MPPSCDRCDTHICSDTNPTIPRTTGYNGVLHYTVPPTVIWHRHPAGGLLGLTCIKRNGGGVAGVIYISTVAVAQHTTQPSGKGDIFLSPPPSSLPHAKMEGKRWRWGGGGGGRKNYDDTVGLVMEKGIQRYDLLYMIVYYF